MTNNRCQRQRNVDAIARSSIHESLATPSSHMAMARCKSSTLNDPKQALDLIRSLVQNELNEKVHIIMQEYVEAVFQPAIQNIRRNGLLLVGDNQENALLEEVCCSALDHAKDMFKVVNRNKVVEADSASTNNGQALITASMATRLAVKRKLTRSMEASSEKAKKRIKSDLPLVTPEGKPIRREGPKWDAKRINSNTLFILGSKACKLLGYKRGSRLYYTHASLFKYTLDQEDKERLIEAAVIPANCVGSKVNILVAEDVLEIAENMDLAPNEILGQSFKCPPNMIDKMKIFIDLVKTDPGESDEMLLKKVIPCSSNESSGSTDSVHDILSEMKSENVVSEEDLGFLQNMNLTSLVREFEMEANGQGSQHLGGILSLVSENPFSELVSDEHQQDNGNDMADSLNDIGFE